MQNTAANVIVQYVQISFGPWLENSEGGFEVQAALYPNASGVADVFRGGTEITGTWTRSTLGSPTKFLNASGPQIPLQPGQTWVELVPNTITADGDSVRGLRATMASSRQSSSAAEHTGMGTRLLLVELARGHASLHEVETLCFCHVEPGRPRAWTAMRSAPYSIL